ncbi:MAG: pantoate--beta-alanine ligase [Ignavibacteriae bacterium]|nr:MAG: pantoate--beta-alanine ligase [Ignavibacteriota bacterium]
MKTITSASEIQSLSRRLKSSGKSIGFVPTMGFLHEGHLSLIRESKRKCDVIFVSIFVNPTQFAPSEDLSEYPSDLQKDKNLLEEENVDFLFLPGESEIYIRNFQTYVNVEHLTRQLEGEKRPTHFRGVTTVVNILFNCVMPDFAFFGQKDAQQAAVINQMVKDLKMPTEVVICPIVREEDGLAMSSRNSYLSKSERQDALILNKALKLGKEKIKSGELRANVILSEMVELLNTVSSARLDYINIVDAESFEKQDDLVLGNEYYLLIACYIGKTRLIDNIRL